MSTAVDYATETQEQHDLRWMAAIRKELRFWRLSTACPHCGEWVGHFGGRVDRDPCTLIPLNLPLDEVRPNCYVVRRAWIGDAIRAACEKRGVQ
jgi:hypothetical protein